MLNFSNSILTNTIMRILGTVVLFEVNSFPASLQGPQRVTPLLVNSFILANIRMVAISSDKCHGREHFPCHGRVPAIFTSQTHAFWVTISLLVTSVVFSASPPFLMWVCRLHAPHCVPSPYFHHFFWSLFFILPCPLLETQKHHIQDLNRNFSRVTFIFNHYFCPRLWHKFLEKNIDSVDYMSSSITTKTNPSTL